MSVGDCYHGNTIKSNTVEHYGKTWVHGKSIIPTLPAMLELMMQDTVIMMHGLAHSDAFYGYQAGIRCKIPGDNLPELLKNNNVNNIFSRSHKIFLYIHGGAAENRSEAADDIDAESQKQEEFIFLSMHSIR